MIGVILITAVLQSLCQAQSTTTLRTSSVHDGRESFVTPQTTSVPENLPSTDAVPKTSTGPVHDGATAINNLQNASTSTTARPTAETAATSNGEFTKPRETPSKFMMPVLDILIRNKTTTLPTSQNYTNSPSSTPLPGTWSSPDPSTANMTSSSTDSVVETSTVRSAYDPFADLMRVFLDPEHRFLDSENGFKDSDMHQDAPFYLSDGESTLDMYGSKDHREDAGSSTTEAPNYDMSKERYCTAARYCYKELNERCITRHMRTVCGCGRAFFRNPETLNCERKLPLVASLELPHQSYAQELADKKSAEFKLFESASRQLVREEAEPLAFPPLASYEPDDQALWRLYDPDLSTTSEPAAAVP